MTHFLPLVGDRTCIPDLAIQEGHKFIGIKSTHSSICAISEGVLFAAYNLIGM